MSTKRGEQLSSARQLKLARKLRVYEKKNPGALKDKKHHARKIAIFISEMTRGSK